MLNPNFTPFPELTTERLLLRQINAKDANEVFLLRSDEQVMKYIDRPKAKNIDEALDFIKMIETITANNEAIQWGITFKDNPKLLGYIGFWQMQKENFRAEIGYALLPDCHKKGIADEALKAAIDYGFNTMNLHSIEANLNPDNIASAKLLEKNNFEKEAYFKENYYFEGKFIDSLIYSLIVSKNR